METLENSFELTGYRVKTWQRDGFRVVGYTFIVPGGKRGEEMIHTFWDEVIADGRLGRLKQVSPVPAPVLGLGSWDPECPKHGQRYTICIEETVHTDFSGLAIDYT
jgi:hypothetical protein